MTTRRAESLAVTLLAAAILGCGAGGATGSGTTQPTTNAPAAATPDLAGYVPYAPTSADPNAATAALTTAVSCTTPSAKALSADTSGTGIFSVSMVDAPNPVVEKIVVKILSVSAHVAGLGWVPLTGSQGFPVKVDILKLQDYVMQLGFATIPAGTVTQIRLLVASDISTGSGVGTEMINYVEFPDTSQKPLKVPSGYQSGIKILGPWVVAACTRTDVTIDFDGKQSIWYHPIGQDTEWILRPVIRPKSVVTSPIPCAGAGTTTPITTPVPPITAPVPPITTPIPPTTTPKQIGDSCTGPAECASGNCVNLVCAAAEVPPSTSTNPIPPTTTPKQIGDSCTAPTECASGNCVSLVCAAAEIPPPTSTTPPTTTLLPIGTTCTTPAECASGICSGSVCTAGGGLGSKCGTPSECLSNDCYQSACAVSPVGYACNLPTDCASGTCSAGYCVGAPNGPAPSPIGTACTTPVECMSYNCSATATSSGTCQPGFQGAACVTVADCATGYRCVTDPCGASSCQPLSR